MTLRKRKADQGLSFRITYFLVIFAYLQGVKAEENEEEECGGLLTERWDYIKSPNYPTEDDRNARYPNNKDCTWRVIGEADTLIKFRIYDLAVEPGDGGSNTSCTYDYLNFTITSIGTYTFCGFHRPDKEFKGMGSLTVHFHSDNSVSYRGFQGAYQRRHNYDPCQPNPCANGECVVAEDRISTSCICSPGFTGEQCEIDINECDSEPCLNGGNCSQDRAPNQYECQCPLGWTGANCESEALHPCEYGPCLYGGTCVSLEEYAFECICPPGYEGDTCDIKTGCGNPGIPYLNVDRRFNFHTRLEFSCEEGYDMIGEKFTECLENGSWSIKTPECKKNETLSGGTSNLSPWAKTMIGLGSILTVNIVIFVSYLQYKSPVSMMERMRSFFSTDSGNNIPANVNFVSTKVHADVIPTEHF